MVFISGVILGRFVCLYIYYHFVPFYLILSYFILFCPILSHISHFFFFFFLNFIRQQAKSQAECYHYLFNFIIESKKIGIDLGMKTHINEYKQTNQYKQTQQTQTNTN